MSVVKEKYRQMIERLYNATYIKKIEWNLDSNVDPYVVIGDNTISITIGHNNNDEDLYIFSIYTENGTLSERFNDEHLLEGRKPTGLIENWFTLCQNLHEMAVRQAKKSDEAIDSILDNLKDFDVPF